MKLIAIAAFNWAHAGIVVERFEAGQEIETEDQDLIDVSEREGWTEREGGKVAGIAPAPAAPAPAAPAPEPAPDPAPTHAPEPELEKPANPAPAAPATAPAPTAGRRKK